MDDKKKMLLADAALVVAAICWGASYIMGSTAITYFTPFIIMTVRFLVAALIMFLLFHRFIRHSGKAEIKAGMVIGFIMFIAQPLQIVALKYTTPSKQAFLVASYAAIVPFMSWLVLRKRPKGKAFFAGLLTMVGIGLICLDGAFVIELGDGLSLIFSVMYSFALILTGIYVTKCDPLAMSFFSYLTTGTLSLIVMLIFEEIPTSVPAKGLFALIYLAVVTTGVAYTLQNVAQRYTSDTHTAILLSTECLLGFLAGIFFYGDPFTFKILIGGLIVFGAVLVSELQWKKKPREEKELLVEEEGTLEEEQPL